MPRIQPMKWFPPRAPEYSGPWALNRALDQVEMWHTPQGHGPEDVVLDAEGRLYTGVEDGRILRYRPDGGRPEVFSSTHGRPLGIEIAADGTIYVADADRGLHAIDEQGRVEVLVNSFDGQPLRFTNNIAVSSDGTVYFSDSSTRFGFDEFKLDLLEHRPNGRLFRYDPSTGETTLLLDRLYFANGVALPRDEAYVLVVETGAYRIRRYWLTGDRAGEDDVFIDNLPGFPDNLSHNDAGIFWVAFASPRRKELDALMPRPGLRRVIASLPDNLQPSPSPYGLIAGIDEDGVPRHCLHGPAGAFTEITGVREHDGWLYLGSLHEPAVARVRAPGE